ncbi:MAG TPA: hypothetical protein VGB85_16855, partial [Nannocystis sp.]
MHARQLVCMGLAGCFAVGCFSPSGSEDTGGASSEAGASTSVVTTDSVPTTGAGASGTTDEGGATSMQGGSGDSSTGDTATGEPSDGCGDPPFIATEELLQTIRDDLGGLLPEDWSFTRYLTLVHLHNAGVCEAEIEVERRALTKLLNSLSRASLPVVPEPVDAGRLVFRIDLRDYTWSTTDEMPPSLSEPSVYYPEVSELFKVYDDRWELLVDQNPYRLRHVGVQADEIEVLTGTASPILRADALVDAAVRPPLYYDALGMPVTRDALETVLELDLEAALAMERSQDSEHVARAALRSSPLTGAVRALERQDFPANPNRAIWQTFDFVPRNTDVFEQPFDFTADGSEVLFNLPNGLHAYLSLDSVGNRRKSVPPDIFTDPAQPDAVARV